MIPVNQPLLDGNEKRYLAECIDTGWISSEGPFVDQFEKLFSARMGRQFGVAVCNGTAAIDAAVEALGIVAGDEVIMPAFTIISCVSQIARVGAIPVLVDSEPDSWNMDVTQIEAKVTPRTKAILAVHIFGLPANMEAILRIADKYGLLVIEDAAEAHGQTFKGRPCGSFGDVSTFSFYPNKHVTTGEGGMILTNDGRIAEECRSLRNLCFQASRRFVHERLGWNLRMTNLQAAVGLAQLERLDEFVIRKKRMGATYSRLLSGLKSARLPLKEIDGAENVYWVFGLVIDSAVGITAFEAMTRLAAQGIASRPFFCPLHKQPVLRRMGLFAGESYPVAEELYERGFYVPSGMALTDSQIERVAEAVYEVLG